MRRWLAATDGIRAIMFCALVGITSLALVSALPPDLDSPAPAHGAPRWTCTPPRQGLVVCRYGEQGPRTKWQAIPPCRPVTTVVYDEASFYAYCQKGG